MLKRVQKIRLAVSLVVLAVASLLLTSPGLVTAETTEEPCDFGGPPGSGWGCDPNKAHLYQSSCEGIDCYYEMETCCAKPE